MLLFIFWLIESLSCNLFAGLPFHMIFLHQHILLSLKKNSKIPCLKKQELNRQVKHGTNLNPKRMKAQISSPYHDFHTLKGKIFLFWLAVGEKGFKQGTTKSSFIDTCSNLLGYISSNNQLGSFPQIFFIIFKYTNVPFHHINLQIM